MVMKHVLLAKFKEEVTEDKIEELIKGYANLVSLVPSMKAFHCGALLAPNFPTSSPLGSVRDFTALTSDLRPPTSVTSLFASGLRPPSSDLRPPTSQFQTARDPEFNKYSVSDNHPEI
ncbi:uncharacterized protein LOC144563547 isoform X2 [Carex rostrata]